MVVVPQSEPLTLAGRGRAPRCHRPENQTLGSVCSARACCLRFFEGAPLQALREGSLDLFTLLTTPFVGLMDHSLYSVCRELTAAAEAAEASSSSSAQSTQT